MANAILNFHFDYWNPSLTNNQRAEDPAWRNRGGTCQPWGIIGNFDIELTFTGGRLCRSIFRPGRCKTTSELNICVPGLKKGCGGKTFPLLTGSCVHHVPASVWEQCGGRWHLDLRQSDQGDEPPVFILGSVMHLLLTRPSSSWKTLFERLSVLKRCRGNNAWTSTFRWGNSLQRRLFDSVPLWFLFFEGVPDRAWTCHRWS